MATEACTSPGCEHDVVLHTYPVCKRQIIHPATYCEQHAQVFLANYELQQLAGEGPPQRWGEAVCFDVELVLIDQRPGEPCQFSLREVGGKRRLDCRTGIFEVTALQRELERLSYPRPLTHRAMASAITALGGRLECVVIDKFFPAREASYEAKLHIQQMNATVLVDVRPSDGLVLALMSSIPIAVSESVLAQLAETQQ